MAVSKCAGAHDAYLECTDYAVTQLNLANVAMYLDAGKHFILVLFWLSPVPHHLSWRHQGNTITPNFKMLTIEIGHAGWLGWPANLSPAAELYANVYNTANKPASLRGLATNVANYNAWSLTTCPSYTSGDANCDEKKYINALAPLLKSAGWDAHFITDTGT